MARRLFVCMSALGSLLLWACPQVWASYPSSYAATNSYRYDPSQGSAGTVYITVSVTGSMQIPSCPSQYVHTPSVDVKLPNGTMAGRITGSGYNPCSNMNFSHVFAFDVSSAGCTIDQLFGGDCVFETQPQIQCPIMGTFLILWKDIEFETAITTSWVSALTKSNGWHPEAAYCSDRTSPPDWPGPFEASPNTASGEYQGAEFMYREVNWGQGFSGVKWVEAFSFISQPFIYQMDPTAPDCTNFDKGYKTGQQVFFHGPIF